MANVSIREVRKQYGKLEVIHGLSLEIAHNEFVVLVGPSGCGKSTMLRMIAGLEEITVGEIYIGSRFVNNVEPKNRNIAMVFQNYALYPHMTVFRNISFGLRAARLPKPEIEERVREAAEILGLTELLDRKPSELSGGQRQRVSMGRAIVRNPEVFLFDEPLSNLDAKLRNQMRTEIKKLHQKVQTTIIYVTHDQIEAMTLADRIVIMRDGYIQQIGAPKEVYHNPTNTFVAGFIGSPAMNMVECSLERMNGRPSLRLSDDLILPIPREPRTNIPDGARVIMGIRPEDLTPENAHLPLPEEWRFQARVNVVEPLGSEAIVFLQVAGRELVGKSDGRDEPTAGQSMRFAFNLENLHIFDTETQRSIY